MIIKSIQYAIFCENYCFGTCNGFGDFESDIKSPRKYFKEKGFRLIKGRWYCKECAAKLNPNAEPI